MYTFYCLEDSRSFTQSFLRSFLLKGEVFVRHIPVRTKKLAQLACASFSVLVILLCRFTNQNSAERLCHGILKPLLPMVFSISVWLIFPGFSSVYPWDSLSQVLYFSHLPPARCKMIDVFSKKQDGFFLFILGHVNKDFEPEIRRRSNPSPSSWRSLRLISSLSIGSPSSSVPHNLPPTPAPISYICMTTHGEPVPHS